MVAKNYSASENYNTGKALIKRAESGPQKESGKLYEAAREYLSVAGEQFEANHNLSMAERSYKLAAKAYRHSSPSRAGESSWERGKSKSIRNKRYVEVGKYLQRREDRSKAKAGGLEKTAATAITIVGLLGGIFFLSFNLTANVVGISQTSTNWIGGFLFIVGLVGAAFYFRKR